MVASPAGTGALGAGALVAGGAVAAGGTLVGVALWSGWLRAQPATATLATRSAVAIARMGRMMVIPFGLRNCGGVPCSDYRRIRSQDPIGSILFLFPIDLRHITIDNQDGERTPVTGTAATGHGRGRGPDGRRCSCGTTLSGNQERLRLPPKAARAAGPPKGAAARWINRAKRTAARMRRAPGATRRSRRRAARGWRPSGRRGGRTPAGRGTGSTRASGGGRRRRSGHRLRRRR